MPMDGGVPRPIWPSYAGLAAAVVLFFLVFPNPLRNPQNNPTASAEYAPIPGRQQSAQDANFGETDLATSGGIGAGGQGAGILPGGALRIKPPAVFNPRHKHCIGNPPRQAEDPLSPPCVPYFDGDNGGATWRGVTRDEIKVVYYNDFGVDGDLTEPWNSSEETYNPDYYYTWHRRTVKAQLRYFQQRFQTYGRIVRMIGYPSSGSLATRPQQRRGEAIAINADYEPFATAILIENAQEFAPRLAEYGVPSFGWNEDVPAAAYERSAPYFWSMMPDQETETRWAASFICRKLYADGRGRFGRGTAKFSTDPFVVGQPRKFGLIWVPKEVSQRGPFTEQLAMLLKAELADQCGITFDPQTEQRYVGNGNASSTMAKFKRAGVTTVICYCVPQISELHVPALQNAATSLNYFPEWYWDHVTAMDRRLWQQEYGSPQHQGFGVSFLWRQPAFRESYPYKAYLAEEPNSVPNLRFNFEIYNVFLNLFSGIQAAGPNLTPETIRRGMFTFGYTNPDNPWLPTGGYGDFGPSPYTFVHTAMAWWYDPTGTPPGGKQGEGCIRVLEGGKRYYGEGGRRWPFGDADLRLSSWPCTEDERRMTEG